MLTEKEIIEKRISELLSEKGKVRFEAYKFLNHTATTDPKQIYPYWDRFVPLLASLDKPDEAFLGVQLLGILAQYDPEDRFSLIFDSYSSLLAHQSVVVSPHVALYLGKIVKSHPQHEQKVTKLLLKIDTITKCKHPELVKAYVIEAFKLYYQTSPSIKQILNFVQHQTESSSPKTRKAAKAFLN